MNLYSDNKDLMGKILIIMSFLLLGALIVLLFAEPFLSADEWFTKGLLNLNLRDMMRIISIDVHPPLYYLINKSILEAFSLLHINLNPIVLVKIASIVPYFIILALSFTVIRKEYGIYASGLFSFSLMAMGIFLTYYLTARMYSWALLFALLSFITVKYLLANPCLKNWVLLSIFSVSGVYTIYMFAFSSIVIYMILFLYFIAREKSQIKNFFISCALNVLLYAPWILILYRQSSLVREDYWIKMESLNQIINTYTFVFPNFGQDILSYAFLIVLILITAYLIKRVYDTKDVDDFYALSGVLIFIGTVTLFVLVSIFYKPIIVDRILIPSMGIFWMAVSIALSKLEFNRLLAIVTLLIIIFGCANFVDQFDDISRFYDETVSIENTLHKINNDDNIVVFVGMQKYVRFHEYLNNTQQYYICSINNVTFDDDYVSLLNLNDSTFKIPEDVSKNKGKKVYVILDWKNNSLDNVSHINKKVLDKTGILYMEKLTSK